jgi:peptide/nickel transport system substrate-binding protein
LRTNDSYIVDFIPLNTQLPPFDDVRVRRALNYAIDRGRIARMYGGAAVATPICQPLASGLAGYRRYCPYTFRPRANGAWSAPDLARAKRLVAASGTRGRRVDVWAATSQLGIPRGLPAYVARVLRELGYRTRLHAIPLETFSPQLRRGLQLTVDGDWLPDYPAASAYLPAFFACNGGHNRKRYVCDHDLDRRMQRASALTLRDDRLAAAQWTKIDHELVDRAYWVPTVNVRAIELVSERLRNYQYNPVWGFVADQVWLR